MRLFAAIVTAAIFAAPAVAGSYTAKPVTQPKDAKIVARDIVWACAGDSCRGATDESRPAVLCQAFAKKAGRLASFTANGRAFTAAELTTCNASAPAEADRAVAEAR